MDCGRAGKWDVMDAHPEVTKYFHVLEDNITLRGRLFALDIEDVAAIPARATAFSLLLDPALRDRLGAALLTKADYSRDVGWNGNRRQLGSSQRDDSWRDLFTAGSRDSVKRVREPLMALLDDVSERLSPERRTLALHSTRSVLNGARPASTTSASTGATTSCGTRARAVPWVRASTTAATTPTGGFAYSKLRILHGSSYTAYFTDALLMAAWTDGSLDKVAEKPSWWRRDDPGLRLRKSKVELRVERRRVGARCAQTASRWTRRPGRHRERVPGVR